MERNTNMHTIIKYELLHSSNDNMDVLGIFDVLDNARAAMRTSFEGLVNCPAEVLDKWLDNNTYASIETMDAFLNETASKNRQSHHWKIVSLACSASDCHLAAPEDFYVIQGSYKTYCSSGAVFFSPCLVNMATKQVFSIGNAGVIADDDDVQRETVSINSQEEETEFGVFNLNEILEENNVDDALSMLTGIKLTNGLWVSSNITLDDAIHLCQSGRK